MDPMGERTGADWRRRRGQDGPPAGDGSSAIDAATLRRDSRVPLYVQIHDRVVTAIKDGTLEAGSQLPSEPELVGTLHVGRPTVRQAISLLRMEGWVVTRRGLGTFVAGAGAEVSLLGFDGLTRSLEARGLSIRDELVLSEMVSRPPLEVLHVQEAGPWWLAVRLRRLRRDRQELPLCVESDCFPSARCPDAPAIFERTGSATAVLNQTYGLEIARCEVATRAVTVPARWRQALDLHARSPVLAMERVNIGPDGAVIHVASFLARTDTVPLVEHLPNPAFGRP
jgi:DNA-binding GntR family transcriptional regulator